MNNEEHLDSVIKVGKRFLIRNKPYKTRDEHYDSWSVHGQSVDEFDIKVIDESRDSYKVEINGQTYWIKKNGIFNWSERKNKIGWVIIEELNTKVKGNKL